MTNLIHWEACDKWVDDYHLERYLKCDHPKVSKIWFFGYLKLRDDPVTAGLGLEIITNDFQRLQVPDISSEAYNSANIPEAEEWLKNLK